MKTKKTTRKRVSRKKAVEAMCKMCIYDPREPGTWLQQVTECTAGEDGCPLFVVRPISSTAKGD
jgi:hypothetical protein